MNNAVKIVTDALSSLTDLAIHLLVAGVIIGILFGDVFGVIGNIASVTTADLAYTEVPSYQSSSGQTYNLRNMIDFTDF